MSRAAADAFASSVGDAFSGIAAEARSRAELQQAQRTAQRLAQLEEANAANLAEKHALREALAKLEPKHPLLSNKSLQERIQKAGETAHRLTNNWDAAAEAGRTFKY